MTTSPAPISPADREKVAVAFATMTEIATTTAVGEVIEWFEERRANCIRLAEGKEREDRLGWLEDATYFEAAVIRLRAYEARVVELEAERDSLVRAVGEHLIARRELEAESARLKERGHAQDEAVSRRAKRIQQLQADLEANEADTDSFARMMTEAEADLEASEARATAAESLCNSYRGIAEQQSDLLGQERARATAPLEALLEALRPFAKEADTWHDTVPDSHRSLCSEPGKMFAAPGSETTFTVGDLRAARAAINAGASNDRK